ncbi:hypothetical protein AVEN_114918-1 [Araneus ventricosus]|uniref:Uncharacterized protein n=1 Tax=Araneus ventricosus TaxID=182803 RepID=A0A4Y2RC60_ARAVE|nr:hypothetical protein AVEN_114918-1 [Araneus ventricosus]
MHHWTEESSKFYFTHSDNPSKSGQAPTVVVSTNSTRSGDDFVFMQDDTLPRFHHEVQQYLYDIILTRCNFYLWGYIKDSVYAPPMPATLQDLRDRIVTAVISITRDQLFS